MARLPSRNRNSSLETITVGAEPAVDANELYFKLEEKYGPDRAFELILNNTKDGSLNVGKLNSKLDAEYSRDFSRKGPYAVSADRSENRSNTSNSASTAENSRPDRAAVVERPTTISQQTREPASSARAPSAPREPDSNFAGTLGVSTKYANEVYDRIEQQFGTKRTAKLVGNHIENGILNTNKLYDTLEKFTPQKDLNKIFFPEANNLQQNTTDQINQPASPIRRLAKSAPTINSGTLSNERSVDEGAFIIARPASTVQPTVVSATSLANQPSSLNNSRLDERPRGREGRS